MATRIRKVEKTGTLKWVRIGSMRVSPQAQRELKQARVDRLVANFDLEQLGYPTLNHRDGVYNIIDGQHRVEALKAFLGEGWEDQQIQCHVYDSLTQQEEADRFDRLNDNLIVTAFDKFRIRVTAGREDEVAIQRIVEDESLRISLDKLDGAIAAVGTLGKVYRRDGAEPLRRSLALIRDSFGTAGFEAKVIDGLGMLCGRYNGLLKDQVAAKKLSNMHGGVKGLTNQAERIYQQTGRPKSQCVAAAAVNAINGGVRGKTRLPNWWAEE